MPAVSTQPRTKTRSCAPWNAEKRAMCNTVMQRQSPARARDPGNVHWVNSLLFSPLFFV